MAANNETNQVAAPTVPMRPNQLQDCNETNPVTTALMRPYAHTIIIVWA